MSTDNGTVQVITSAGKEAANRAAADGFKEYMIQRAELEGEGLAFEIASGQVAKILDAANSDNESDLWDADELDMLNGMDMTDVEQRVNSFTVHKATGEVENPWGVFIVVQATRLSDGADVTWNTGAISVVSKLRAFEARGMFPLPCVIRGTKSGKGTVLKLRPIPVRAVQAK
jgi:hypothetical protein